MTKTYLDGLQEALLIVKSAIDQTKLLRSSLSPSVLVQVPNTLIEVKQELENKINKEIQKEFIR